VPTLESVRQYYPDGADAVHGFDHIQRVLAMAERLALIEGADLEIVRAAALLHDAQGSLSGAEERVDHHEQSALFAAQVLRGEGWSEDRIAAVQHCIRAHRYRDRREPPATLEAKVVFDADKLDVLGAIGAVRVVVYAALAGQPTYVEPSEHFLKTGVEAPGEPHSAYHEWLFKLRNVRERLFTDTARAIADERTAYLAEFFERLGREMRGEA